MTKKKQITYEESKVVSITESPIFNTYQSFEIVKQKKKKETDYFIFKIFSLFF